MSKNGNVNLLLNNENRKLLETEKRLINEGIIFKRRIFSHKKENEEDSLKSNNVKKNLSIKLNDQYIYNKENSINYNNMPVNTTRGKKSSFIKQSHLSVTDNLKKNGNGIKKNNYIKTKITNNLYSSKSPHSKSNIKTNINNNKNILKHNSYKINNKRKSLNDIYFKENKIFANGCLSPRISCNNIKLGNGFVSPLSDKNKYHVNLYTNRDNQKDSQKFNYKKWNKILINNIFDKDINNEIDDNSNNNGIVLENKENNGMIYNNYNNDIKVNDNGIQEIFIQNVKKEKKSKINDIPRDRKKHKSNNNIIINSYIDRNNIVNYCKQMSNLALIKDNKNSFIRETVNGLKFDQIIRSPENKKSIKINKTSSLKKYKSSNKKTDSMERIITDNTTYPKDSFSELKLQKTSSKNKSSSKKTYRNNVNTSQKKYNKYNYENKNIYRNDYHYLRSNSNSELNSQIIKIKNSKLLDFIKNNDASNNKKELIINKYKEEDIIKEDNIELKDNLNENLNEDIFNSNTDIFNEKEKGPNNYTFDNKYEIDSEHSFRFLNNYTNNIFDNNSTISKINKSNINDKAYSLKHTVFTKKIIGGINLKANNFNNAINKINEKENKDNNIDKNKIKNYNGDYIELAKICANQEKIISDLVKNVQQLNNKICDKDLCINELNNQLYSIKYNLLNTMREKSNK